MHRTRLAGAGGKGLSRAAAACRRLSRLSLTLQQQPLFASAFSDDKKLEAAITDAAMRAMTGTWGAVDFALLFVANYSRPKKFSDPSDAAHAATLLRGVLGKDIPIVGCCCSGVMGVGRDSRPAEVDPATSRAMSASLVRRLGPGAPRRGVSLLLGRLPPGWVARTLAPANLPTDLPQRAAAPDWPEFSDALALTATQAAQLAADVQAAAGLGGAGSGSGAGSSGTAVLQPETALLLYQSEYQGTEDLDATIAWLQAHAPAMQIVGGASSGRTGDLLISPGAAHRLGTEAPPEPPLVGLLLCSAHTGDSSRPRAAAAATEAAAAAAAAAAGSSAAGSSRGALPPAAPAACSSAGSLRVACMSVQGVGPAPGSSIFVAGGVSFRPFAYAEKPPLVFIMSIESATILTPGGSSAAAAAAAGEQPAAQRSERTAAAAGASAAAPALNGLLTMIQQLEEAGESATPMVAVWRCPAGAMPAAFTGAEESALVMLVESDDSMFDGSSLHLTLFELCHHPEGSTEAALQALVTDGAPGSLLCMQFVQFTGEASARAIARGFKTLQQQLQAPPPAATAPAAAGRRLPGSAEDCYAALARTAAAAGARSSRRATAIFSCTGRGVSLFRPVEGAAAADAPCEAALVDAAWQQQAAFAGCYVDGELGPPVRKACLGFGESQPQQQAYTSMFAVLSSG